MIKIISKDKYFVDVRFFDQITISYSIDNSLNIFENIKKAVIDMINGYCIRSTNLGYSRLNNYMMTISSYNNSFSIIIVENQLGKLSSKSYKYNFTEDDIPKIIESIDNIINHIKIELEGYKWIKH